MQGIKAALDVLLDILMVFFGDIIDQVKFYAIIAAIVIGVLFLIYVLYVDPKQNQTITFPFLASKFGDSVLAWVIAVVVLDVVVEKIKTINCEYKTINMFSKSLSFLSIILKHPSLFSIVIYHENAKRKFFRRMVGSS